MATDLMSGDEANSGPPSTETQSSAGTRRGCLGGCGGMLLLLIAVACWPPFYRQGPIRARVVDNVTKEPIRGASLVGVWSTESLGFESPHYEVFRVDETLTDQAGHFTLAAWGPKPHWPFHYLDGNDQEIFIYKPGYQSLKLSNSTFTMLRAPTFDREGNQIFTPYQGKIMNGLDDVHISQPGGSLRHSFWNGRVIGMEPAKTKEAESASLEVPFYPFFYLTHKRLPLYWRAWMEGWRRLPPSLKEKHPEGSAIEATESGSSERGND